MLVNRWKWPVTMLVILSVLIGVTILGIAASGRFVNVQIEVFDQGRCRPYPIP
jgi:uncharacterized integral membrane protein